MVTIRWEQITGNTVPTTKPTPKKSLPATLGTPRVLRSATTPTPSPITPQRQRMSSMRTSDITPSPMTASPSIRGPRSRLGIGAIPAIPPATAPRSATTVSPSVTSRVTSSIATTAATSVQSEALVTAPAEKISRLVPDISRIPQITQIRRTPEVERGVFDPISERLVCSTRFAARAGSEKKIYILAGATTHELGGAWSDTAALLGLDAAAKRPTCLAVDCEKIVVSLAGTQRYSADKQYGCSDGGIVVVVFS